MPANPRYKIVDPHQVMSYHIINRCVRQSFLLGNQNSHRKEWLRRRLEDLSKVFFIEIGAFSFMDNHIHLNLKIRPDLAKSASNEDIVMRMLRISPSKMGLRASNEISDAMITAVITCPEKLTQFRQRSSCLSWFMRCFSEAIARAANKEDKCSGRFWDGRFKSIPLLDDDAKLKVGLYVDLNPIRANIHDKVDMCTQSSIYYRLNSNLSPSAHFLAAIDDISPQNPDPYLPIKLSDYVNQAFQLAEEWRERISNTNLTIPLFSRNTTVIGNEKSASLYAAKIGKKWVYDGNGHRCYAKPK